MQEEIKLIQCASCTKDISPLAAQCPNCGAPNEWIHPAISEFLKIKDQTGISRPFTFQWNKVEIWGESKPKASLFGWLMYASLVPLSVYLILIHGILGIFFSGLAIGCALQIVPRVWGIQEKFKANLAKMEWESSNDRYWEKVKLSLHFKPIPTHYGSTQHAETEPLQKSGSKSIKNNDENFIILALSIFWRTLIAYIIFSIASILAFNQLGSTLSEQLVKIKPTVIMAAFAALMLAIQVFSKKSIIYYIIGERLHLPPQFWARLTYALASLFIALSALNIVVAFNYSTEFWLSFSKFIPVAALFFSCIFLAHRFTKKK